MIIQKDECDLIEKQRIGISITGASVVYLSVSGYFTRINTTITMVFKFSIFIVSLLLLGQLTYGQNGKLFFIKDKDTLNVAENNVKVFIELDNHLISFNQNDNLIYPDSINPDSINSIIVLYNTDTLSFYNFKEMVKFSRLPLPIIKTQLPIYSSIFSDKRNMYFTVDKYPFDNKERKQTATMNLKTAKTPLTKMIVTELYYQVTEMHLYEPKKRNNR